MADAKWIKIAIDMFNDPKLKIINSMEEKDLINYVWMRSLLLAGQSNMNGCLYINESMPYTMKTLAIEFDRAFEDVKLAFKVLRKLEMLEVTEDRIFRIKNWAKHQNVDELEKLKKQNCDRVAKHRAKKKEIEESNKKNVTEINIDEDKNNSEIMSTQNNDDIHDEFKGSTNDINCDITGNVTDIQSNITVMEQNKKENKTKKKNKTEIENKRGIDNIDSNNCDDSVSIAEKNDSQDTGKVKSEKECNSILSTAAIKLLQHYEQVTGIMGGLDIGSLRLAISTHGEENVRKAIDEAIETGKTKGNMRYINGILRNWRKEGYPEDDVGGINNGAKSNGKGSRADSKQFKGIKPKKCRELTEEERKNLGAALI
ncbi:MULTISPECIES: phage replisome organizer N-terminal domain-containing protein [Clostridium]|uniref:phage replisome organizer N-terminal domain-containing protein n=1 Tax=Clostridium TaxID=1485 RepID=UPI00071B0A91|nr:MULTISPECIES: phage replisome organizer N-terminal domain-containing protein [Clostridium]ALP91058.1 hypothetical protein ATN24_13245 [Clostridium butyricum]ANF14681.1 hypothetical protein AZ909_11695 [Clostridium butyricum]AOR94748.1 hypothetical protein BBB49_11880 [Clostridium butyricum]MCI3008908.1 phage replisome organizer N-terminal domain-containing protein [Clostridium butyricum]MDP0840968.1 phage replisome organizer N-terminal domain-containing protein [Clostridium butyricum]